jgi:hypothetical protein
MFVPRRFERERRPSFEVLKQKRLLAILVALGMAAALMGVGLLVRSSSVAGSARHAVSAPTLSPHEIHLNYKSIKNLPANEVKEPF